ncbi:type I restriction-modification system subunit M [Desulfobacula sp.]|uniref:type I restriction-modification system subunit M n=1 Tax=Desulfobacula sp. TaxID=2593537 RepID=UPI0025C043F5|nr:type I restriction-modification system subunit M [Desulfobacula sp.]MBC2703196.1 N-6 DNA methylase [Desulfobacula sp.]
MLQNNPVLKSKINQLWDKFWSGGIANPLTAIEQITYLLFMKRLDDLDLKRKADAEFTKESYTSKFEGSFTLPGTNEKIKKEKLRWSYFKHMQAEEMLAHVQAKVFPFLKELNGGTSPFTKHIKNAVFIIPKPALLVEAIKTIEDIFEEIEKDTQQGGQTFQDIQGDVYEMLLSEIASAGKNGQFRTPRHIIKLMAELVEPKYGHKIADPACGTAGFLLGAYQYIVSQFDRKKIKHKPDEDGFMRNSISASLTEKRKAVLTKSFFGYDFDVTMVRLGLMNLMMHDIDDPEIDYKDTLSKAYNEENQFDIVLANPPFKGSIDKGDINEALKLNTTKTELLFVERIFNMLRIGGTAAMIIPQGVLFGAGKAFVNARKLLIEKSELKAVITMPSGVFKPYAGVSTAILIFTKAGETQNIWFYDMQSDGYSLDDKRTKLKGYGDLQDIVEKFKKRDQKKGNDRKKKYFFVLKQEVVDEKYDLTFNRYREDVFEEVEYEKPKKILTKLKLLEKNITEDLLELEEIL